MNNVVLLSLLPIAGIGMLLCYLCTVGLRLTIKATDPLAEQLFQTPIYGPFTGPRQLRTRYFSFTTEHLGKLGLIKEEGTSWALTHTGRAFIEAVTSPAAK